jgi:hypothetical protein
MFVISEPSGLQIRAIGIEMIQEPEAVELPKYALDEMVSLYEVLPLLSFKVEDILKIISGIDNSNVEMAELVDYFNKQNNHKSIMIMMECR